MSELHLALLALGVSLLLALFVSEKLHERRLLRRLRERMQGGVGDALLQGARDNAPRAGPPRSAAPQRPRAPDPSPTASRGFAGLGQAARPGSEAGGGAEEGAGHSAPANATDPGREVTSEALTTPAVLLAPDWDEDPLLDCSLEIRCARAVDGVSVIDAAALLANTPWRHPVHFVVWDGRHQQWVLPDRFGYYTDALASIQLADRRGRIDEAELLRFVAVVREVAEALDADVDAPDIARLLVQAQELDRLCARFDIQIGLTVESAGGAWTGPQLRNAAQQAGFDARSGQAWIRADSEGAPLFALEVDPASMNRMSLELDVPGAPVEQQPFRAMVAGAQALAASLGGRVVDDNGMPIEEGSLGTVEAQLARVYEEMRAAGIEPGSARARRLYVS